MENTLLLTIILLFVILILVLVIVGLVVFILFKNKNQQVVESKNSIEPSDIKKMFEEQRNQNEQILGLCAFCEKELIKNDFYEIEKLHFCREHFNLYTNHKWIPITNELTTGNSPESAIYIYNFKKNEWDKNKEPMYIQCEYKIDVITDEIETYVQLHVIEEKAEILRKQIEAKK